MATRAPTTWSEYDSKRLLAAHGVPITEERLVADPVDAGAVAIELGGRVAVKLCGSRISHKTERGLVLLGLEGRDAVETAAGDLLDRARPDDGEVGVLVSAMVSGNRELIVGVSHDGTFGPVVMLGFGGILAEAVGDVVFRRLPVQALDIHEMLEDLATQQLLGPFRGEPAVDRDAVAEAVVAIGAAAATVDGLAGLDVNPMIVVGAKPVAVDALVVLGAESATPAA